MRFLGETEAAKIEGVRAVEGANGVGPRLEITWTNADGNMGVLIIPAREGAFLRDLLHTGLMQLQGQTPKR